MSTVRLERRLVLQMFNIRSAQTAFVNVHYQIRAKTGLANVHFKIRAETSFVCVHYKIRADWFCKCSISDQRRLVL